MADVTCPVCKRSYTTPEEMVAVALAKKCLECWAIDDVAKLHNMTPDQARAELKNEKI